MLAVQRAALRYGSLTCQRIQAQDQFGGSVATVDAIILGSEEYVWRKPLEDKEWANMTRATAHLSAISCSAVVRLHTGGPQQSDLS